MNKLTIDTNDFLERMQRKHIRRINAIKERAESRKIKLQLTAYRFS